MNNAARVRRSALWWGIVITVLGALSNGLYFLYLPGQGAFPWINLVVPIAGLVIVITGVWRESPRVGQKAPTFTLVDSDGETVSLAQLLSGTGQRSDPPKAVLLIFYRGYW